MLDLPLVPLSPCGKERLPVRSDEGGREKKCPTLRPPWTVAGHAPLPMEFPRQEYWSGLPFPSPGDLSKPGIEPVSLASPALAGRFFTTELQGKPVLALPELI